MDKKAEPFYSEQPSIFIYQYENNSIYYASLSWEAPEDSVLLGHYNQDSKSLCVNMNKSFRSILTKYMDEEIIKEMLTHMYKGLSEFENSALNKGRIILNSEKSHSLVLQDYMDQKITNKEMKKRYRLVAELEKHWNHSQ